LYNVTVSPRWQPPPGALYKWLDNAATHAPDSPWFTFGRFGEGRYKTLYLAESARGAVAEYLRRHPEFLDLQDDLDITIYAIDAVVPCDCLDVRQVSSSTTIGFPHARLGSSDDDEAVRYSECRALGADAVAAGLCGLAYLSAAATWATWNLVLFGESNEPGRWQLLSCAPVARPVLAAADVNVLT
jgi:hypothetical protein